MPMYVFSCKKCGLDFEELCKYDEKVKCPACKSKKTERLLSNCSITFTNPKGTSKFDSFSYRAGYNYEKAQGERRQAEATSRVGKNPYKNLGW